MSQTLRNLLLHITFRVAFYIFVYFTMEGGEILEEGCIADNIERKLETIVKGEAGQMIPAKVLGAPQLFLHKRFPTWKEDKKTYMIPPVFIAKGHHQIGIEGSVPYSDTGELGESIIYDLLRQLGELKNIGMFVIHGFELKDIPKWNKKVCQTEDYLVPDILSKTGECDFIIFHHTLGVISLEVKNYSKMWNSVVLDAENQLEISHELIKKLATYNANEDSFDLTHRKVIAMPSTKMSEFNRGEFSSLQGDTLLLFKEDSDSIESFLKWWNEAIESPNIVQISQHGKISYEQALSYTLMIRHLGPVTESEFMANLHQSLVSQKFHGKKAYPQILESHFPNLFKWCKDVLSKKDEAFNFGEGEPEEQKEAFMKHHKLSAKDLRGTKGIKLVNRLLKHKKYIAGDEPSVIDETIAVLFADTYLLFFENIVRFINAMRHVWNEVKEQNAKEYSKEQVAHPFLKLESLTDLNTLDRHLSKFTFIEGDEPGMVDKYLFETLTCQMRLKHAHLPLILTSEQLAVFEGPYKQLIIGPPGSGKTELMKFKALELEIKMKACKEEERILYIVANGSPDDNEGSLLFYHIKDFFKKSTLVDVIVVVIQQEFPVHMEHTMSELRLKIKEYGHVFIDEYWIGSKPAEHKIILELVNNIPGYVWISSVFDYNQEMILSNERMITRTKPLLMSLEENGGVINHITQVLRATNNIINLERGYSDKYQNRSYPYGTRQILGHSLEGLPITWAVEESVDGMYSKCVNIIDSAMRNVISLDAIRREKLTLDPADIIIINFAIRTNASLNAEQSLQKYLEDKDVPYWTVGGNLKAFMDCKRGEVTLLQSFTRKVSSYLDGVEWPMVIVILPSGLLLNTAKLAKGAEELRNYDPYISFFRTMIKLVVISDKWKSSEEFLADIALKSK